MMKSEAKSPERASMDHAWCRVSTKRRKYGGLHTSHQWQSGNSIPGYDQRPVAPLATAPDKVTCEAGRRAPGVVAMATGRPPHQPRSALPMDGSGGFFLPPRPFTAAAIPTGKGGRRWLALAPWEAVNYSARTPPPAVAAAGTGTVGLGKCSASIEALF